MPLNLAPAPVNPEEMRRAAVVKQLAPVGQTRDYVNTRVLDQYARIYPWLAPIVGTPDMLMQFIDQEHQNNRRRASSGGTDLFRAKTANNALTDIYGINAYNPKGMLKWDEETKQSVDPRVVGSGEGPRF